MSIDEFFGNEITLRAAAELFNITFVIFCTLGRAVEATITPQNFAEIHGKYYVVFNPVEDPDISNESFDSELKKTTDKSILNPVENFDKPN